MKHNKRVAISIFTFLSLFLLSCGTTQSTVEKAQKAQLIDEQIQKLDFKFIANYANPQSAQSIYLSPNYDVKVTPDTVKAYLPYYGRAYRAPMNSSDGGIKFESTDFESLVEKGRRDGEWRVTIHTKDTSRPFTLYFSLWNNGSGSLQVQDQDRQSISFQGTIEEQTIEK